MGTVRAPAILANLISILSCRAIHSFPLLHLHLTSSTTNLSPPLAPSRPEPSSFLSSSVPPTNHPNRHSFNRGRFANYRHIVAGSIGTFRSSLSFLPLLFLRHARRLSSLGPGVREAPSYLPNLDTKSWKQAMPSSKAICTRIHIVCPSPSIPLSRA